MMFAQILDGGNTSRSRCPSFEFRTEDVLDELGIEHKSREDYNQLDFLLKKLLTYPSSELAQRHHDSNRLGTHDLKDGHPDKFTLQEMNQFSDGFKFCTCCGFLLQPNKIKICTKLNDIHNLGISTYLYFQALYTVIYLLLTLFVIYAIFSLITNLQASNQSLGIEDSGSSILWRMAFALSLASKQINATDQNMNIFTIQTWLGVGFIVIWIFVLAYLKGNEKRSIIGLRGDLPNDEDDDYRADPVSASDFSVLMEGVPKSIDKQRMQQYLRGYKEKLMEKYPNDHAIQSTQFIIAKYNVGKPFYLHSEKFEDNTELKRINEDYEQIMETFMSWIEERKRGDFEKPKHSRQEYYHRFKQLQEERILAYKIITQELVQQFYKSHHEEPTNTVFITFTKSSDKNLLTDLNEFEWRAFLRDYLFCCFENNRLIVKNSDGKQVPIKIYPAPEPEDIIWVNLGHSFGARTRRRLITFFATLLILCLSFLVVYGLSVWQKQILKSKNNILSLVISLIISIFNLLIQAVIRQLTVYERDYTETNHQTSLAVKSVLALLINSIAIPIIVSIVIGISLHDQNGMTLDVFLLGITNSFLSPFLKIVDPLYFYTRLLKKYKDRPSAKLQMNQNELNGYYEGIPFEAGYQYIYIINLYLFTCFFVPLQPLIVVFAILGLILMSWTQKFSIYNFCKRPVPGNKMIHIVMTQFIYLGPLFYTIGNYLWKSFFPQTLSTLIKTSSIVSLVLSLLILFLPFDVIFQFMYKDSMIEENLDYYENRILLPSEYDRLNPATSDQAIKEYLRFIDDYKRNINQKKPSERKILQKNFFKQIARGVQQQKVVLTPELSAKNYAEKRNKDIIQQIFHSQTPLISQILVGASVLPMSKTLKPDLLDGHQYMDMLQKSRHSETFNVGEILKNRLTSSIQPQNVQNPNFIGSILQNSTSSNILDTGNTFSSMFRLVQDKYLQKKQGTYY